MALSLPVTGPFAFRAEITGRSHHAWNSWEGALRRCSGNDSAAGGAVTDRSSARGHRTHPSRTDTSPAGIFPAAYELGHSVGQRGDLHDRYRSLEDASYDPRGRRPSRRAV